MAVIKPIDPADESLLDLLDYSRDEFSDDTELNPDASDDSASSHQHYFGPGAVVFHVSQNEPPPPDETDLQREAREARNADRHLTMIEIV